MTEKKRRKIDFPIGKQMEADAFSVNVACALVDFIPPATHAKEDFVEFIELIVYCNEHKMYEVRDRALKKILEDIK